MIHTKFQETPNEGELFKTWHTLYQSLKMGQTSCENYK